MKASERLTENVITQIRDAINDAGGNEVFFTGTVNSESKVNCVTAGARGNSNSVPALDPFIEKGDVVIHNHPGGNITPSNADLNIASHLGNRGIGFFIVDNSVNNLYAAAEPVSVKENEQLNGEVLAEELEPGGGLSVIIDDFEARDEQILMLKDVCESFNTDSILIIEAGTGVGKSIAYLIPVLKWVTQNDERIVITTATINLQQQLMEKDIPLAKKILKTDPKVVLVKGRGNYICLTRLKEAIEESDLFEENTDELNAIKDWAAHTKTGSKSDLSVFPSVELWSRICSEADICRGLRCSNREQCFVLKARREAASAKVLVVNHHLLFSDLALRISGMGFDSTAVLPPFKRIIFDEAHNIESSATSYFSDNFSKFSIRKYLNRLFVKRRGRNYGHILKLRSLLNGPDREKIKGIQDLIRGIADQAELLDRLTIDLLSDDYNLLLEPENAGTFENLLLEPVKELTNNMLSLVHRIEKLLDVLSDKDLENDFVYETKLLLKRLKNIAQVGSRFMRFMEYDEEIFWIEKKKAFDGSFFSRYIITPLFIAPLLNEAVIEPYPSVVFTSATLTVNNKFTYWKSRLGINSAERCVERIYSSPFNYKDNVMIFIPEDAPEPSRDNYQDYSSDFISRALEITEGRALILFTSYRMLNETYNTVMPGLNSYGINTFRQGEDERTRLLEKFKKDFSSVLFATDSFWEGVDSPGETLEVLILCRLPFRVPTEPVLKARAKFIMENGGNPFMELSLPDAIMKFRQGFGRLIRKTNDKGIIIILDSRVISKFYGKFFLSSVPETNIKVADKESVLSGIEDFIVHIRS
jgi:ATP-dependent DNA helicase DinG